MAEIKTSSDQDISKKEFWQNFFPKFNIEKDTVFNGSPVSLTDKEQKEIPELMIREGYYRLAQKDLGISFAHCTELIKKLHDEGLDPVFAYMYDELWLLQAKVQSLYKLVLGEDCVMHPTFWAWLVSTDKETAGWGPHRDRDRSCLRADGSTRLITMWIPITEATPMNGCVYMVPAYKDRHYNTEKEDIINFDFQDIRALLASPGDVYIWNHEVYHWGARAAYRPGGEPRISLSYEYAATDTAHIKSPILDPPRVPSYEERVKLVAMQILQYAHMTNFPKNVMDFALNNKEYFKEFAKVR